MSSMCERVVFTIIKDKLDWYVGDAERFKRWLIAEAKLSEAEAENMRLYFVGDATKTPPRLPGAPTLVHGFARQGGPFPCWAFTLGGEDIATDYLGRDAEFLDSDGEEYRDAETGAVVDPKVRRMRYTFNVYVYAAHPDVCVIYYHLLKQIVMSAQQELHDNDVEELVFSGRDLAPDPRYLPADLFTRLLSITVEGDETWEDAVPMGTRVTGIFSPQGTTGLPAAAEKAGVTTYTPEP